MPHVRVLILRAPGTNCDQETAFAFQQAGGMADVLHVSALLTEPAIAQRYQVLCLPGGFSYGDDIAAGRIVAGQIRHHLFETLMRFRDAGKLLLGICNGFQILLKSGLLLPDEPPLAAPATLTWNASGRYEDRWVHLRTQPNDCVFLRGITRMYLPLAHAEGRFVARDASQLTTLAERRQLPLRYAAATSVSTDQRTTAADEAILPFPDNPNGSEANVAGVCDVTGRVFGLMPHPERYIHHTQHPHWTRLPDQRPGEGLAVFRNAVDYFV
jgi:phosphoribosylformylglycinamidine synthase